MMIFLFIVTSLMSSGSGLLNLSRYAPRIRRVVAVAGFNPTRICGGTQCEAIVFAEALNTFNHGSFAAYDRTSSCSRITQISILCEGASLDCMLPSPSPRISFYLPQFLFARFELETMKFLDWSKFLSWSPHRRMLNGLKKSTNESSFELALSCLWWSKTTSSFHAFV